MAADIETRQQWENGHSDERRTRYLTNLKESVSLNELGKRNS